MMIPRMRPAGKFIFRTRMIMLVVCLSISAFGLYMSGEFTDDLDITHQRKLQDLSIVNSIDGPGCGAESTLKQEGLFVWVGIIIYLFVGLAIVCDDYFVPSLEVVAEKWHLTEDVAGATLMAGGTSSTQLFAALIGVFFFPDDDSGPGTIVGSVVFNICVIIGATMIVTEVKYGRVTVDWYPLTRDSVFNIICLWSLFAVENSPTPGEVQWWGGLILLVIYSVYVLVLAFHGNIVEYLEDHDMWDPFWYTDYDKNLIANKEEATVTGEYVDPDFSKVNGSNSVSMVRNPSVGSSGSNKRLVMPSNLSPQSRSSSLKPNTPARTSSVRKERTASVKFAPPEGDFQRRDTDTSQLSSMKLGAPYKTTSKHSMASKRSHTTLMTGISKSLINWEEQRKPRGCCAWIGYALLWPWHTMYKYSIPDVKDDKWKEWYWPAFGMCIIWLGIITFFVVDLAAKIGACLGLSANVTGLTILAIGASLPDGLSSMIAARDNKCQMAVCNAFGSNLFDILIGLGAPWLLSGLVNGTPVHVSVHSPPQFILATGVQIIFTIMLVARKLAVDKMQGFILLMMYGGFVVYVVVQND